MSVMEFRKDPATGAVSGGAGAGIPDAAVFLGNGVTNAGGDEVSIADLSLYAGYWRTKGAFPELVAGMANLERWGGEIGARPGVQRALKI